MSGLEVAADEQGVVRVFAIDVDGGETRRWRATDAADWPLPAALGVDSLDARDVAVFRPDDIAEIGLPEYLSQGHDVAEDELAPARATLQAEAPGLFAVIRSGAFAGPVTLRPEAPVRFLGTFHEPAAREARFDLPDIASARPGTGAATASDDADARDEEVLEVFRPDRGTYVRSHLWLAAAGMVGATAVLYAIGNADYWVGAVAALLAVAVRGGYLASEELSLRWELTESRVQAVTGEGRPARTVALRDIARVRTLGSAVQIVTKRGDKVLLKYMAEPARVQARIAAAAGVSPG